MRSADRIMTPGLLLQLTLQAAHEFGEAGAALALQPLSLQDRLHLGKGVVDVLVDDDVVVLDRKSVV